MTSNPFLDFIRFVECDRNYYLTKQTRERFRLEIEAVNDSIKNEKQRIESLKNEISSWRNKVTNFELDIKDTRSRRTDLDRKLPFISNPKEYMALHKEIEERQAKETNLEEAMFAAWQNLEALQGAYDLQKTASVEVLEELERRLSNSMATDRLLAQDEERLLSDRALFERDVKADFLEDFNFMKQSIPDPIVPIQNNSFCSGCHCQISQSDLARIKRHVLVTCRECFRKLYSV